MSDLKTLTGKFFLYLKGDVSNYLHQEWTELRGQFSQLDQQLAQRYPERYPQLKQQAQTQVNHAKTRIEQVATPVKERLQTLDPEVIQQQRAPLDAKVGQWGHQVAQQERKFKQYLRQQLQQRWQP